MENAKTKATGTKKTAEKKVEIAYVIPVGREMRFAPKRKIVAESKLAATVDALVENGARDFSYADVAS